MRLALPFSCRQHCFRRCLCPIAGYAVRCGSCRRARAQKKNSEKPAKVITDDTLEVKKGRRAERHSGAAPNTGHPSNTSPARLKRAVLCQPRAKKKASDDEQRARTSPALKEQIKQAQSDLDLAKRELALQQDTYFSNVNYVAIRQAKQNSTI